MIKVLLLAVLAALPCCGTDDFPIKEDDHRFYRYRAFFEKHTGHKTGKIPILYSKKVGSDTIAECVYVKRFGRMHNKYIRVNKKIFDGADIQWRRAVIAHELIHCHLEHMHHTDTRRFELMNAHLPIMIPITEEYLIEKLAPYRR